MSHPTPSAFLSQSLLVKVEDPLSKIKVTLKPIVLLTLLTFRVPGFNQFAWAAGWHTADFGPEEKWFEVLTFWGLRLMSGLQYLPVPLGVSWRKCHWIRLMPPPPCARLCCTAVTSSCCYSLHSHAEMEKGSWRGKWLRMLHHPQPPPPSDHLKKTWICCCL